MSENRDITTTPLYDRLVRAHAHTDQRPLLTRALDPYGSYDDGWRIKFCCGHRGTRNRWEYVRGDTIEDAALKALDMRAKAGV